ncbi:uncharacterized protein LOC111613804 [Centruroides sculpturatus]|uniref:uncharacterized protein LOC111613804 n=1 Tax=Centruroides sculpturatus TaxID=218467 RepID=UPI000C6D7E56|nr:uncharacterized protein LOC111613804 [Centruroides sculpturatus]
MGSPISGLLCDLVVRKLEEKVLRSFEREIVFYKRYVDDLFIIWRNNREITSFIDRINDNEEGLSLKLEQKSSMMVHFLDINIIFSKGHVSTGVYIKPTHSPLYIPAKSNDPYRYKMAAFRALVRRAFLYCDNIIDRVTEIERIIQLAEALGYKRNIITGIVKKFEKNNDKVSRQGPSKYTKFTFNKYLGGIMKEIASVKDSTMAQAQGSLVGWEEAEVVRQVHSPTLARTAEKMEIYRSKLKDGCINARDAEGLPSAWKFAVKKLTSSASTEI